MSTSSTAAEQSFARPYVGCAGWSLPRSVQKHFPAEGSHLQRYASVFPAVEINSSFYRPHRPDTYARWRDSVPPSFRFSAKVPKAITHELRLQNSDALLQRFLGEAGNLEEKLGCLLVQLPPGLQFNAAHAGRFFNGLRNQTSVDVVCEPRHPSWFAAAASELLAQWRIPYVIADPPVAALPPVHDGQPGITYIRLLGSPVMYYSGYSESCLDRLAADIRARMARGQCVWCIFDNTAAGAAVPDALSLLGR
jgi:uncharacterized protein YecE (DUF72 family)